MATAMPEWLKVDKPKPKPVSTASNSGGYATGALNTVRKSKPKSYSTYKPRYKPGQTYDMSRYSDAIGTGPRQVTTPQAQTPQTFNLTGLQQAIQKQQQTGSPVQVDPARFQNTQHLASLLSQMNEATRPLVQSQQQAATGGYNNALQKLQSSWASRGLGASGAAAAQEVQGANALAQQLAQIAAQQQAQNIGNALNFGQLGLQESGQRFAQQANNRDFEQARSQQNVANLLSALNTQEQMRQNERNFGLDVERLKSAEQQNYLNQLANYTGMGMQDNQWSQQFGLERQAQDFDQWYKTKVLNSNNENAWLSQLLAASGQAADNNYRDMAFGEQQKQANIGNAMQLSQLFGQLVQPKSGGAELFSQVAGSPTLAGLAQALQERQFEASPQAQPWYLPMAKQQAEANLKNTLRSANAPYGGGGSGGSGGSDDDLKADMDGIIGMMYDPKVFNNSEILRQTGSNLIGMIDAKIAAGIMPPEYGERLKSVVYQAAPGLKPKPKPLSLPKPKNTSTKAVSINTGQNINPWSGLAATKLKWPWE